MLDVTSPATSRPAHLATNSLPPGRADQPTIDQFIDAQAQQTHYHHTSRLSTNTPTQYIPERSHRLPASVSTYEQHSENLAPSFPTSSSTPNSIKSIVNWTLSAHHQTFQPTIVFNRESPRGTTYVHLLLTFLERHAHPTNISAIQAHKHSIPARQTLEQRTPASFPCRQNIKITHGTHVFPSFIPYCEPPR